MVEFQDAPHDESIEHDERNELFRHPRAKIAHHIASPTGFEDKITFFDKK